jgi:addiction module RelE/StbE family toxin
LDKYKVSLTSRALRDLDGIYVYIAQTLLVPETALGLVDKIEKDILSLEEMPYRFPERKTGAYANRGYRQLFVGNYTVIYRVDEIHRQVIVVTIRYSPSQF